ncbi:MAG: Two-component system response regulator [Streptosporangiaceae bacterium]|jgi:two-component system nitrate/nitrite response regulator NarL|nr:Two-component system response regulator [Streptosporangiaceae bacterium]
MVRVLVLDENPVMELGLHSLLNADPEIEVVGGPSNGSPMAEVIRLHGPDVILLGASPPAADRIRALARDGRGARIIVLTSVADPAVLLRAVAAGAHSCIIHGHFKPRELAEVVLATARGQSCLSATVVAALVMWLHGNVSVDPRRSGPGLTPREIEIMGLISGGLNNRRIADRLVISEKTVKNHVHSIYKRLGADGRDHAIERWHEVKSEGPAEE